MKTKILIPILFLVSFISFSQDFKEKREKIKALKVAYITDELSLTTGEAQKFWPIYNTYDDKQFNLRHQKMRSIVNKFEDGGLDKLTDKEATALVNQMEAIDEELYLIKKKFVNDLQTVISAKKIIKLKKTEDNFNRKLLKQFRGKRE
jgi:Spy/CpxP family protein refolding chaperone